ncbi:MAG TPA: alpha/beta fold hydrolase [Myxococcaceae bacterium]|nr:alpha/beta fold hydrolase [Myxococcaceae bacterium]
MDTRQRDAIRQTVRELTSSSPKLSAFVGGTPGVDALLDGIEDVWMGWRGTHLHLDFHRAARPRATIVFQTGVGSYARAYFLLGAMLARRGYHFLGVDRPGHGLSPGPRGECTVEEALESTASALRFARETHGLPVVLLGSSFGGLLTGFSLLTGQRPELAIAHNFLIPGKLASMRLRSRYIHWFRQKPYRIRELAHDFKGMTSDPALARYFAEEADPGMAWRLSAPSVASLLGFDVPRERVPRDAPPLVVLSGMKDDTIPSWASRLFLHLSGLPRTEFRRVPGAGHLLFHEHLDLALPVLEEVLDAYLPRPGR